MVFRLFDFRGKGVEVFERGQPGGREVKLVLVSLMALWELRGIAPIEQFLLGRILAHSFYRSVKLWWVWMYCLSGSM